MKKIAPSIYASTEYPGVNVGFIVAPEGVIAVDAPALPHDAHAWRQRIVETAGGPILYVVLTDAHPDRLLSARLLDAPIVASRAAYERAAAYTDGFWRGVVEGWIRLRPEAADDLAGLSGTKIRLPEILFTQGLTLHKGGADVTVRYVGGAAPGSAWIHLPEQDVLFAGDTLVVDTHPFLYAAADTKVWLEMLTALRRPRFSNTSIVPGRGPLSDQASTRPLSEYITLARRRVRSLLAAGQARVDTTSVVQELLPLFSVQDDERELAQRRIKAGLEHLIEQLGAE